MRKTLLLPWVLLFTLLQLNAQVIEGYWQGKIGLTKTDSLTVGFYIQQTDSTLHIEADSPDQYSFGLNISDAIWSDSTLSLKMPTVGAAYKGKLSTDGRSIKGIFSQNKRDFPLILEQGHVRKTCNRPQTPLAPYPYREEEIRIQDKSGRFSLINGTLTMPTEQPKALVILISGSGWQDRDEAIFGHKPFLVIADHLTRNGYAVFRYDDFPRAIFAKSTTFDFADGVIMIFDTLTRRPDLAALPIGLLGHSEGSMVAEITAACDPRVKFIISIGGVAQKTADVLRYQLRAINEADGTLTPQEIDNSAALSSTLYRIVEKSNTPQQAAVRAGHFWDKQSAKLSPEQQKRYNFTPENRRTTIAQISSPWFFTFFHINPKKYLKKIKCPFLALGGEKDLQVNSKSNNLLFEKYLPNNVHHQFIIVPNTNHLLQPCITGAPQEYGQIEETIHPESLTMMVEWLNKVIHQAQ